MLCSRFSLVIYFIHSSVYINMSISTSQSIPLFFFPLYVHPFVLYACVYISALQRGSSVPFSRFHICVLIYNICFSLSDLLHPYDSFQVHPCLCKCHNFIPFNCPTVYMHHIFFIHSSVDGHLGCFDVVAVVNSVAMKIGVHVSFGIMVFSGLCAQEWYCWITQERS